MAVEIDAEAAVCAICTEAVESESPEPLPLRCGHAKMFHAKCLEKWTRGRLAAGKAAECPICREVYAAHAPQIVIEAEELPAQHPHAIQCVSIMMSLVVMLYWLHVPKWFSVYYCLARQLTWNMFALSVYNSTRNARAQFSAFVVSVALSLAAIVVGYTDMLASRSRTSDDSLWDNPFWWSNLTDVLISLFITSVGFHLIYSRRV